MKNFILGLMAICTLGFLVGCACDERYDEDRCSASTSYDSKDMTPYHHHHHHHVDTDNQ